MTTTTVEHTITVTKDEARERAGSPTPWAFSCSCGHREGVFSSRDGAELEGEYHQLYPTEAKARDIGRRIEAGRLTAHEIEQIRRALGHAASVVDGPASKASAECAVETLVKLVRGES